MSELDLKSYRFRAEREDDWRALEGLLERIQNSGVNALKPDELVALPQLYRTAVSSLSTARAVSLDRNLITYLETLCTRGYLFMYGPRVSFWERFSSFFRRDWPDAVRSMVGATILSAAIMFGFALIVMLLVLSDSEWFYPFAAFLDERTPEASQETLRATLYTEDEDIAGMLSVFASQLFTHNTMVALLCFALGFMVGIPTAILLAYNGCILGAYVGLYVSKGLGFEIIGWLMIHGVTELFAIILAAAAGFVIGKTLAFPGEKRRVDAMADAGKRAGNVGMGVVVMLFLAALLEGFGRQLINDDLTRYMVAGVSLLSWLSYFYLRPGAKR
ncbi:stage II sporulation protein M [Ponticaulis sp.]|uniref:stage II sporulation protein M n=1 Tax=Ponticaulis sp. TaxID=2020902 RepID=UPI002626CF57|nr:stage II sporulation protein M [Ponticaulis sp.]MDF1681996.1 stage II sporulation protein M [Ponticaulis sp.]